MKFWTDWTGYERTVFVVLALLALPLLVTSPSLLGIGLSFLVLIATIGVWLWFNRWVSGRHPSAGGGPSPNTGPDEDA